MLKLTSLLIICIIALTLAGCGGGGGGGVVPGPTNTPVVVNPTATPTTQAQVITQASGGTVTYGQSSVSFPANSVKSDVTVTTSSELATGITAFNAYGSIYNFTLSNSTVYDPNTATITLPISTSLQDPAIYHSNDKINWTNIGGTVSGSSISVKVPGFSYFVVGTPKGYVYDRQWGQGGSGDGYFTYPAGIAIDSSNNVFVADSGKYVVQKFSSTGSYMNVKFSIEVSSYFVYYNMALDSAGGFYISQSYSNKIYKYSPAGLSMGIFGGSGTGNGQLSVPYGIAIDNSGKIYVSEFGNKRIQKFDSDPNNTFILKWGQSGTATEQFNNPMGLTVDSSANVYVVDNKNFRIQKFTSTGTFITTWGTEGTGNGEFKNPTNIAVDSSGYLYVTDTGNKRVQKFDSNGKFITKFGTSGSSAGQFTYPAYIAVNTAGWVYVVDSASGNYVSGTEKNVVMLFKPQ